MPNGIVIIDKPQGWTSMDVCAKLRGILHEKRVGHAGTLDPMATGVLPVFVGQATKAVSFAEGGQKVYEAVLQLGLVTDTQDTTGETLEERAVTVTEDKVRAALPRFLGEIEQIATRRQSPFPARISDVGVVKDLATHDVDLAAWVAGAPYESIYARTSARSGREHEDMMVASGVLAGGILVNHLVNWLTPYKDRTTIVTGERGALVADTAMGDLTFYENGHAPLQWDAIAAFRGVSEGQVVRYALTKREPLALEHERFRDAILGVGSEHVTMDEALDNLRVVEAILSSAASGRSVDL